MAVVCDSVSGSDHVLLLQRVWVCECCSGGVSVCSHGSVRVCEDMRLLSLTLCLCYL